MRRRTGFLLALFASTALVAVPAALAPFGFGEVAAAAGGAGGVGDGSAGGDGGASNASASGTAGNNGRGTSGGGGGGGAGTVGGNGGSGASGGAGGSGGSTAGGQGGKGGDSTTAGGGGGGGGGGGAHGYVGSAQPTQQLSGGAGGAGGGGNINGGGGGGGAGGYGLVFTGSSADIQYNVLGGAGGAGGNASGSAGDGGAGGDGGYGILVDGQGGGVVTLVISGSTIVRGGDGGEGGSGQETGNRGAGGIGISGANLALTLAAGATVEGGQNSGGRANAIQFTGGNNVLELRGNGGSSGQTYATITGHVLGVRGYGESTTLKLGGGGGVFDLTKLAGDTTAGAQFQKMGAVTVNTTGTWVVTGTQAGSTGSKWTVDGGTLQIGTSATSGTLVVSDNVNVNGGAILANAGAAATVSGGGVMADSGGTIKLRAVAGSPALTIGGGSFGLLAGSTFDVTLGAPTSTALVDTQFNLTYKGALVIASTGNLNEGSYTLVKFGNIVAGSGNGFTSISGPTDFEYTVTLDSTNKLLLLQVVGSGLYWNGTTTSGSTGPVAGGDGTWSATSGGVTNWTNAGGTNRVASDPAKTAIFAGTAGTVSVDNSQGTVQAKGLKFVTSGYTIGGGTLTLADGTDTPKINVVDSAALATISAPLAGTHGLEKVGAGTLTLTGTSSLTGDLTVSAGILAITSGGKLTTDGVGTINGTAGSAAEVVVSGSGSNWTNGSAGILVGNAGSGKITVSGGATLTSDAVYLGRSAGGQGSVTIDGTNSSWTSSGVVDVGYDGAGQLTLKNQATASLSAIQVGMNSGSSGTLQIASGATLTTNRSASYIGNQATANGQATVTGSGSQWTSNQHLNLGLSGTGSLTVSDSGLASFASVDAGYNSGASGTIVVDGGSLTSSGLVSLGYKGTGSLEVKAGGTVTVDSLAAAAADGGAATVTLSGANSRLTATNGANLGNGAGSTSSLTVQGGATLETVSGDLFLQGGSVTTIKDTDTVVRIGTLHSGTPATVNDVDGRFRLGHATATVSNGAHLEADGVYVQGASSGAATMTLTGSGTVLDGHVLIYVGGNGFGTAGNGSLTLADGAKATATILGIAVDSGTTGAVVLTGAGTSLTTVPNGTYLGNAHVGSNGNGTLVVRDGATLTVANILNIATNAGSTGELAIGAKATDTAAAAGTVTAAKGIKFGAGTGTITFNHTSPAFELASAISGAGHVTQMGSGTTILTGANTYTGGTTISGGTLQISAGGSVTGGATITGGTLQIGTGGSITGDIANAAALVFDHSDTATYAGQISGAGTVTKKGTGTLTLTAGQSYTGDTVIDGGTLAFATGQSNLTGQDASIALNTGSSATLNVTGSGTSLAIAKDTFSVGDGGTGTLTVSDGAVLKTGTISYVGRNAGSTGTVTITGGGSTWDFGSVTGLRIGSEGTGSVTVAAGGALVGAMDVVLGDDPAASGTLIVTGAKSRADFDIANGALNVGMFGKGTLTVSEGGSLTSAYGTIAGQRDSTGTATVAGEGSSWTVSGLYVGYGGNGTLTVSDHGKVTALGEDSEIGTGQAATGQLTVTGAGSTVDFGTRKLTFGGDGGTGTLIVSEGASVTGGAVILGSKAGSTGSATVTGKDSVWTLGTAGLTVGDQGKGALAIADGGTLVVGRIVKGATAQGGTLALDGGTLRATADQAAFLSGFTGSDIALLAKGAVIDTDGHAIGVSSPLTGAGGLEKKGAGTLTLTGFNTYAGTTTISAGTLVLADPANQSVLPNSASVVNNATLVFDNTTGSGLYTGVISGTGTVIKKGSNALFLTGDHTYTGGTVIEGGQVVIGGALPGNNGAITGDVTLKNGGIFSYNRTGTVTFAGTISGDGSFGLGGGLTLTLTGTNTYTGNTVLQNSTLVVGDGASAGSIVGDVVTDFQGANPGHLIFDRSDAVTYAGKISGSGSLEKRGSGTLTLTGVSTLGGGTTVSAGTLQLSGGGRLRSVEVASGAILTGDPTGATTGTVKGLLSLADGATLKAVSGATTLEATTLSMSPGAIMALTLGAPSTHAAVAVSDGLTLGGTLNLTAATGFASGTYRVFGYEGPLAGKLTLGTIPARSLFAVDTATTGKVDLVVAAGQWWNGTTTAADQQVHGGDGTWTVGGPTNWTDQAGAAANAWTQASLAVFAGKAGTVTVDSEVTPKVAGLEFLTSGYTVTGGGIALVGFHDDPVSRILVQDDAVTGGGSATLAAALSGGQRLEKTGSGTLTLTGDNTYGGGTLVSAGTLRIGAGGNSGAILGDVVNKAALVFDRADDLTYAGVISGSGTLEKAGAGTLTLTGASTLTGLTTVSAGTLRIGDGGANAALAGAIVNNATLVFDRGDDLTAAGSVTGSGRLIKRGAGTLTLTGANSAGAGTSVAAGTLALGGGTRLDGAVTVQSGAVLAGLGGETSPVIGGSVSLRDGATLRAAPVGGAGVYSLAMDRLDLAPNATLAVTLGAGAGNSVISAGTLSLGGSLDVTDGDAMKLGVYRLIDYTTLAADNGLRLGVTPLQYAYRIERQPGQVNLAVIDGSLLYWNGATTSADGSLHGGSGTWSNDGRTNWTTSPANQARSWDGHYAVFAGAPGTVTVAASEQPVSLTGMQFMVDGYTVTGAGLTLAAPTGRTQIRVGDGTADGAASVARVDAPLGGTTGMEKTDLGTLILGGANTYTGGTLISAGTLQVGDGASSGTLSGDVINTATLVFDRADASVYAGAISGSGTVIKRGAGTLSLTGASRYSGDTTIAAGAIRIQAAEALGTGALALQGGGTLQAGASFTDGRAVSLTPVAEAGGGTVAVEDGQRLTLSGVVSGAGALTKTGPGTLTLTGANTYAGATTVASGRLEIAGGASLSDSAALTVAAGAGLSLTDADETVGSLFGGGGIALNGHCLTASGGAFSGSLSGSGCLSKKGAGTLTLSGRSEGYSGTSAVVDGILRVTSDAGALGSGALALSGPGTLQASATYTDGRAISLTPVDGKGGGTFLVDDRQTLTLTGVIAGLGNLAKTGTGTLVLGGSGLYAGATEVTEGTLIATGGQAIGDTSAVSVAQGARFILRGNEAIGSLAGAGSVVLDGASLSTDGDNRNTGFAGVLSGSGGLTKTGSGTLTLSGANTYTGDTRVAGGGLALAGSAEGDIYVQDRATLSGGGRVGKTVHVLDGGTLAGAPGAGLSMGALDLAGRATLAVTLGAPSGSEVFRVAGDVRLGGTLAVTPTTGFGLGVYRILSYGGRLTDTGMSVGALPNGLLGGVQTSVANQVNLFVEDPNSPVAFWNGGTTRPAQTVVGGSGTWSADARTNWTNAGGTINRRWPSGFAVFQGTPGTVTVDPSAGAVQASGMQFVDSGYVVTGGAIGLTGTLAAIRVGDGTTAGAASVATIASALTGTAGLEKSDLGTLILTGANSYAGGTAIKAGTLQIGDGGTAGSISGNVANDGTLAFNRSDATRFDGAITGTGKLVQAGTGTTVLAGTNSYSGGTTIAAGTLQLGQGGTAGSITGNVANSGTLAFNRSDATRFDGAITGTGKLVQAGTGTTVLTGTNSYSGGTTIAAGTLQLGQGGTAGSITGNVANSGTLAFNRSDAIRFDGAITGTGRVVQAGTGTTVLTGTNSYSGGTTIAAGTLQLGQGGTAGSISGNVANNGTLAFNRSDAIRFDGAISGTGRVVQAGTGTTVLTGTNSYGGGTAVTAGTLRVGSDAALGAAAGGVSLDGGTLAASASFGSGRSLSLGSGGGTVEVSAGSDTLTLSGAVSGAGGLTKAGDGTLLLLGTGSYAGRTTVKAGTLQIGNGGTAGSIGGELVNEARLVFNRSDTYTFQGNIKGAGEVAFTGGGRVLFTATDAYTGTVSVNDTVVRLDPGSATTSPFTVDAGGVIGGTATIGGLTVNGGGTASPGYSPGTLTVTGPVAFNAGALYAVDVTPDGQHDLITATGPVTLSSQAAVQVHATPGRYAPTARYTILSTTATLTGRFGTVTSDYAFLDPVLSYDAQNVYLGLTYTGRAFTAFARSRNQFAVAEAAERLGAGNRIHDTLMTLAEGSVAFAFDQIGGEVHPSINTVLQQQSVYLRDGVGARLRQGTGQGGDALTRAARGTGPVTQELGIDLAPTLWAQAFGGLGQRLGGSNAASISNRIGGMLGGIDVSLGEGIRAGVVGSVSQSSFDLNARASNGSFTNYSLGVYAGGQWDGFGLTGGVSQGWHDVSALRAVAFPGFSASSSSRETVGTTQVFGEATYEVALGAYALQPFAGLAYVDVNAHRVREGGLGGAGLTGEVRGQGVGYTTLGLRAATTFALGDHVVTPSLTLGWQHALGDVVPEASLFLPGGTTPFGIAGIPVERDMALVGAGLAYEVSEAARIQVNYTGQVGARASQNTFSAQYSLRF
ncbi:autotransporter-associated beta strand repeat-containing protein [Methylorubrum populi]